MLFGHPLLYASAPFNLHFLFLLCVVRLFFLKLQLSLGFLCTIFLDFLLHYFLYLDFVSFNELPQSNYLILALGFELLARTARLKILSLHNFTLLLVLNFLLVFNPVVPSILLVYFLDQL